MRKARRHPRTVAVAAALTLVATIGAAHARPPDPLYQRLVFEHAGDRPVVNVAGVEQELDTRTLEYARLDGEPVSGYLARPADAQQPMPGVVVIHEWWGLNGNVRAMTERLAAHGFTALAVDLYEGETAETPEQARSLMQNAMSRPERLQRNLRQAFMYLDVMPSTERIGSIGWCFGGGWSLRTALMFPEELDATVIYYGELVTDRNRLEPLTMPILGHFGAEDSSIPPERARAFERVLGELEHPHQIHIYEDAGHAFANPSGPRYAEAPAERAWQRTVDFLDRHLQSR